MADMQDRGSGLAPGRPAPPTAKLFRSGTHRVRAPRETVETLRRLMPALGITRVADVTGLDVIGIPVVMVIRPNARSLSASQGKGRDLDAAKASGLMEAIELWHAEHILAPMTLASFEELRFRRRLCDIRGLPRPAGSSFHAAAPLLWMPGRDLLGSEPVLVPFEVVHTNYTLPPPTGAGMFLASSTGLAGGNHPLEALSHAICEIIERDAHTLWALLPAEARHETAIDLDSVTDSGCRELLDACERANVEVAAWDITSDVGIAAFYCRIVDRDQSGLRRRGAAAGLGCHLARDVALARAITEAVQSRLTLIAGSRDDMSRADHQPRHTPAHHERPTRRFDAVPSFDADTFEDDIAHLLARVRAVGIEQVIAVDLSRPELQVPVVRVIVPGLEATMEIPNWSPGARARARLRAQETG